MGVAFFKNFCILLKTWFLMGISAKRIQGAKKLLNPLSY